MTKYGFAQEGLEIELAQLADYVPNSTSVAVIDNIGVFMLRLTGDFLPALKSEASCVGAFFSSGGASCFLDDHVTISTDVNSTQSVCTCLFKMLIAAL